MPEKWSRMAHKRQGQQLFFSIMTLGSICRGPLCSVLLPKVRKNRSWNSIHLRYQPRQHHTKLSQNVPTPLITGYQLLFVSRPLVFLRANHYQSMWLANLFRNYIHYIACGVVKLNSLRLAVQQRHFTQVNSSIHMMFNGLRLRALPVVWHQISFYFPIPEVRNQNTQRQQSPLANQYCIKWHDPILISSLKRKWVKHQRLFTSKFWKYPFKNTLLNDFHSKHSVLVYSQILWQHREAAE